MQRRQISMWSAVPTPMLWIRSVSYKGLTRVLPLAPPGFVQVGKMVPPALRALDCYPGSDVFIAGETCFVTHQGGATQKDSSCSATASMGFAGCLLSAGCQHQDPTHLS